MMVQVASNFESTIIVEKDGIEANGKSIMGVLLLAAAEGSKIVVRARGKDAKEAIEELSKLIEGKFGEE
jgi:phosphocarrier protein HPr